MNRGEYIRRLEELLQDIPEEERKSALEYYEDYLEEADLEEEQIVRELGSPERIAAIIKTNLIRESENRNSDGEFTEFGYYAPEFEEQPNFIVPRRKEENKEKREEQDFDPFGLEKKQRQSAVYGDDTTAEEDYQYHERQSANYDYDTVEEGNRVRPRKKFTIWKFIWLCMFIFIGLPIVFSIMIGTASTIFSILVAIFAIVFSIIFAGFGLCIAGIISMGMGAAHLFVVPINGIYMIGSGLVSFGIGLVLSYLSIQLWKKVKPAITGFFKGIRNRKNKKRRDV